MIILFLVLTICFLINFSSQITKMGARMYRKVRRPPPDVWEKLVAAKAELHELDTTWTDSSSMYTHTILRMRAENKVKELQSQFMSHGLKDSFKGYFREMVINYSFKGVMSVILAIVSWYNYRQPVIVFNDKFNFQPFSGVMSFPTGIPNAISIPMWALCCNATIKFVRKILNK